MADFNGFKKNGTTYDCKDATARTDISAINGKIPSGASSSNKMATASDITTVTNGVKANTKLIKDTVGWSGKNKGYWVNKSLSGDPTNGYLLGDNGSSIIAKIENNTNYKVVKKDGQGNRFRVILFVDMPSYTPSLNADQVIHDNTAHEVSFSSGNYNYAVLTYDNASAISQDTAEAMIYDADILDPTYEPYHNSVKNSMFPRSEQAVLGAKNLLPYPYAKALPWEQRGVTFSDDNGKGSINVNGTNDGNNNSNCPLLGDYASTVAKLPAGDYILTTGNNNANISIAVIYNTTILAEGNGTLSIHAPNGISYINLYVKTNGAITNEKVYPMIRLASDSDDTYVPYAMTNRELTDAKLDKNSIRVSGVSVDDLTTAGIYYCAGEMTGLPYGSIGTMIVIKSPYNTYQQIYIPAGDPAKVYIRRYWESAWSSWYLYTGTVVS